MISLDGELRQAVLAKADQNMLEEILRRRGHLTLRQAARQLVASGRTSPEEIARVLGVEEGNG
jgi:type II secretory ATPase GspE/PulE/Tfp pilus assembly ATPase PilB-like protein